MLHNLLKQKNPYYSNLSAAGQARFQERVLNFMASKYFVGREGLVVTDEMKVLISAAAVQLTFGLKDYTISHLQTINIFPGIFYSKLFKKSFKGLTTEGGVLSISWNDFKEGFENEHDSLNLGFHELAHALNVDLVQEGNFDEHFSSYFEKWKLAANNDFLKLKAGKITFFRNYGATNLHEFFAVCVEHFFESPLDFKEQLPNLYEHTALLLNQDPCNVNADYQLDDRADFSNASMQTDLITIDAPNDKRDSYPEENKFSKFVRTKGIYTAMATTVIGLFIGIPLIFWLSSVTVISIGGLFLLLFVCGMLGLIQWRYVKNVIDMEYHQFTMYAFTGFGMCLVNFILLMNYNIRVNTYSQTYEIARIGVYDRNFEVTLAGDHNNNALERGLANYMERNYYLVPSGKKVTITFDTGLFGMDVINNCTFE